MLLAPKIDIHAKFQEFLKDEDGANTILNVAAMVLLLMFGGLSVDSANAWRVQNQLQATSDAAVLAAAMHVDDPLVARVAAQDIIERNMPASKHGTVVDIQDLEFGKWDPATKTLDTSDPEIDTVRLTASRRAANSNAVPTHLLRLAGVKSWDISVVAMAAVRTAQAMTSCAGATIVSANFIDTGGGNTLTDGVCFHGATGILTGGNDFFDESVMLSAESINDVTVNSVAQGSASAEDVSAERELDLQVQPLVGAMFDQLWDDLYNSGATTYSGDDLPSFIFGNNGFANIVRVNQGWWSVQQGDLVPNTIYLVNHGMQLSGGVDASNIAIIAKGQIGIGGGPALHFNEVYFHSTGDMNFSGDVLWGNPNSYCDTGEFTTYLLTEQRLSLGGWGPSSGAYGVMGAAKTFSPGGAMKNAGGLYIESRDSTQLGGNMTLTGCDVALEADLSFDVETASSEELPAGSYLIR